jgi:serine/threonine protein kinase
MGVVVLAQDTALDILVAVKLVPDVVVKDTESVTDLRKEVLRGMALMHTGIVRTHNFEKDEGGAGIIMEYVDGDSLADLKMRQPGYCFEPEQILPWIEQLCSALDYAHREARIVHRDIKPRNLMLTKAGRLKIADFGTAAIITDSVSRHSMEGSISGTLSYMSPQQAEGKRPTILDDIHAVGATIYELLTGKPPFFRGNALSIHNQIITLVPPRMSERREELEVTHRALIPAVWETTIAACLAKDPAVRPQSAMELVARLKSTSPEVPPLPAEVMMRPREPVSVPPSLPPPLPIGALRSETTKVALPPKNSGNKLWIVAAILLLAIMGGLAGSVFYILKHPVPGKVPTPIADTETIEPTDTPAKTEKSGRRIGLPAQVIFGRNGSIRYITRGFLDGDGKVDLRAFDRKWKFVTPFYGNLFNVQKDNKWGMINDSGEIVHEPQWDDEPFLHDRTVLNYSGDFAFIQRAGNFGFIDKSGKVISQPQWEDCNRFTEGLAVVKRNGKYGYIETSGAVVIDLAWSSAGTFSNGAAPVSRDNKWGYIDKKGTLVIPLEWDECLPFTEQLAAVRRGVKWGYINRAGKVVIPIELDGATFFSEGLAAVKRNEKWGSIDASGVDRIGPRFDGMGYFVAGIAPVTINGKAGVIGHAGTFVIEPRYDSIRTHDNGLSVVSFGGKEGLVDRSGKEILAQEWNMIFVGQCPGGDLPLGFVAD